MIKMGKRVNNWLSKANGTQTKSNWKSRWNKFAEWLTTETNPLTDKKYMYCSLNEVDDLIRKDFEDMPSHLFQDKYKDILSKYITSLTHLKSNTALAYISGVRSFFTNECVSIALQKNKLPSSEMASNEHRFTLSDFQKMWLVADTEGKSRLSLAVSLGWSIGEFISLKSDFIKEILKNVDNDGYVSFDYRRQKSKARARGILNPSAVKDLKNYIKRIPEKQVNLWSTKTRVGINYWFKTIFKEAGIQKNGTIRFHLIRKYVYDIVSSRCGIYEAKLLTGKKIPLADETYLHGLEDRLLERYKKFGYSFLRLDNSFVERPSKDLEKKVEILSRAVDRLMKIDLEELGKIVYEHIKADEKKGFNITVIMPPKDSPFSKYGMIELGVKNPKKKG